MPAPFPDPRSIGIALPRYGTGAWAVNTSEQANMEANGFVPVYQYNYGTFNGEPLFAKFYVKGTYELTPPTGPAPEGGRLLVEPPVLVTEPGTPVAETSEPESHETEGTDAHTSES